MLVLKCHLELKHMKSDFFLFIYLFIYFFFFCENETCHFMWIFCQASTYEALFLNYAVIIFT